MTALILLRSWWFCLLTAIDRRLHPDEYRGAHYGESINEDRSRHEDDRRWWV